jgi:HPt (histidine-containing phosphotransfer) domain-containing protein
MTNTHPGLELNTKPAIDVNTLHMNLGGLGDEMAECIGFLTETFLEDAPQQLAALHQGILAGDADTARFCVHTLKSSSATLGALYLAELCLALENQAKVGDLSQGEVLYQAIVVEYERVKLHLQELASSFS